MSAVTLIMLPTFLMQFAAGCYLAIALSAMRESGWKYLRLVAVVSLALVLIAGLLLLRQPPTGAAEYLRWIQIGVGLTALAGAVWLFVNAGQADTVQPSQRPFPAIAGLLGLATAIGLALCPDILVRYPGAARTALPNAALAGTTLLGAGLLGSVTCGMLLGHRYLTDTDLSILPLRRMAKIYLWIVVVRSVWLIVASIPIWSGDFRPRGDYVWFWLMVCIRGGIGVLGACIFAWMAWDCVRRRATQSATAIFYLSMIFVFLGELSGQYLSRTESLAM